MYLHVEEKGTAAKGIVCKGSTKTLSDGWPLKYIVAYGSLICHLNGLEFVSNQIRMHECVYPRRPTTEWD